ncbi:MAG: type II secretion system protein [Candidatus Eremiobacterota bacterium]
MRRRAFSLVEAMASMFLIALVLGLVGSMLGEYARISRFAATREQLGQALQVAMDRILSEVRGARQLLSASPDVELRFLTFEPANDAVRLPLPVPTPRPASWDPYPPASQLQVRYYTSQGHLVREATSQSGTSFAGSLCDGVAGLSCQRLPTGNLEITLSVDDRGRIVPRTTRVRCPLL